MLVLRSPFSMQRMQEWKFGKKTHAHTLAHQADFDCNVLMRFFSLHTFIHFYDWMYDVVHKIHFLFALHFSFGAKQCMTNQRVYAAHGAHTLEHMRARKPGEKQRIKETHPPFNLRITYASAKGWFEATWNSTDDWNKGRVTKTRACRMHYDVLWCGATRIEQWIIIRFN